MFQVIKEFLGPVVALIVGVYAYRKLSLTWRILLLQVLIYCLTLLLAYFATSESSSNHWVYNSYMLIEALTLGLAGYFYFKEQKIKQVMLTLIVLFVVVYFIYFSKYDFDVFANYMYAAQGVFLIPIFSMVLYYGFRAGVNNWTSVPEIWVSIGILMYFGCLAPYLSMYTYLGKNYPDTSRFLFHLINDALANIRYFLLAFGFFLMRRNILLQNIKTHEL
jgi:hypothetical protein